MTRLRRGGPIEAQGLDAACGRGDPLQIGLAAAASNARNKQ
jgi:hypothetical protein